MSYQIILTSFSTQVKLLTFQLEACKAYAIPTVENIITTTPSTIDTVPTPGSRIIESDCSRKCGLGERTVSKISWKCPNQGACLLEVQEHQEPCNLGECPPSITFGPWSDWSQCSISCKTDYQQKSVRSRIRTLKEYVPEYEDFKTETQECFVPMCPFECPKFHLRLAMDDSDPLGLKVCESKINVLLLFCFK